MAKNKNGLALAVLAGGLAIVLLIAGAVRSRQAPPETPVIGTSFLMDTVVEYKLYGANAAQARTDIEAALRGIETQMSMYLEDSDISRLNRSEGGAAVPVADETAALLLRCGEFGDRSAGVFDVTIAPLTAAWGITSTNPVVPARAQIDSLLTLVDYRGIAVAGEPGNRTASLAGAGMAVDVGGVAKGYACDVARAVAAQNGITSGYISIGGNLMVVGGKPDGEPFRFGVRDPRGTENSYLAVVTLPDSTMATSGDYERFFEQDGVRYHHILDPRTGYPADGGLLSVSVVSPDGARADFLSTWLFIQGKDFVLENLNRLDCGLIVVDAEKNVYVSDGLQDSFTPGDETGTYRFVEGAQ